MKLKGNEWAVGAAAAELAGAPRVSKALLILNKANQKKKKKEPDYWNSASTESGFVNDHNE